MRLTVSVLVVLLATMVSACNSSNFLVYKDAKHFYVTSKGSSLREILCDSGDLSRITKESKLPQKLQEDLMSAICSSTKEANKRERVLAVLESMTKDQRNSLKEAFEQNGYRINVIANC